MSICIPTYNAAEFIAGSVASALAQDYESIELLISDDASSDGTVEMAEALLKDARFPVTVLRHERLGLVQNWNFCVQKARGKYIKFLFQDDLLEPDCVSQLVRLAEQDPEIGLVFSRRRIELPPGGESDPALAAAYRDGVDLHRGWTRLAAIQPGELLLQDPKLFQDPINKVGEPTTVLLAKAALERLGGFDENLKQLVDVEMWLRIMTAYKVGFVDRVLSGFRLHRKQATQANLKAGLIAEDWKRFFLKLAQDPVFAGLSEAHRSAAARAAAKLGGVPAKSAGTPAAESEFFGAAQIKNIEQLIAAYADDPSVPEVRAKLEALRQGLAGFLAGIDAVRAETLFRGDFGRVYRAILKADLPRSSESAASLGAPGDAGLPRLLARMLSAPAHYASVPLALERIPAWFLDEYLAYVLHAPQVFVVAGEADIYREHMLGWARSIRARTRSAPDDPVTLKAALHFALKANYIPLYFTEANTRELAELRAGLMEFVLERSGASLNAIFKQRPKERKKIKVGFLNAHFGAQTETHVTLPGIHLDRNKFEIVLFPVLVRGGPLEDYCRSLADQFVPLPSDLASQVKTIRAAELDVVIIGTNITAVTNQVSLLALHRLAPLQLVSYCSPVSTGMRQVDGYLTGTLADFAGSREHFSEHLHCCVGAPGCLDYTVENRLPAARFDRAGLGIGADEVVFVNAAACYKILPELQETWARIIQAVPKSRLLLLPFNPNWSSTFPVKQFEGTLAAAFRRRGLSEDRFILASSLPSRADVKELEKVADVYLDTFPFSGSISVIDPLELGLPPVIWEGSTHRSRMAAALLRELAIPEVIASNEAGYVEIAVRLASDATFRGEVRTRVLEGMARKPSFVNPEAYGKELGDLLERLVLKKQRPAAASKRSVQAVPALVA